MVYIDKNSEEHIVISRTSPSVSRQFDLKLINNLTNEMIEYPNVISASKNDLLYCFIVNTLELIDGEYTYFVFQKGRNLDTGLLRVGEIDEIKPIAYQKDENIIVYNG